MTISPFHRPYPVNWGITYELPVTRELAGSLSRNLGIFLGHSFLLACKTVASWLEWTGLVSATN
jgi:hypothetical protein